MIKRKVNIDKRLLLNLDEIQARLKFSVTQSKIIRWLENFEDKHHDSALNLLFHLEYISHSELTMRIDEQLSKIVQNFDVELNFVFISGTWLYPKSSDLINYILKDTPTYIEIDKNRKKIIKDFKELSEVQTPTILIIVDDFLGTGGSFKKFYDTKTGLRGWLNYLTQIKDVVLLAPIIMYEAKNLINDKFPEISLFGEIRHKAFDTEKSPFTVTKSVVSARHCANVNGSLANEKWPLGFGSSESLVSFSHTTPNNSLPIFWGNKSNWFPIFPRFAKDKIQFAKEIKTEIAFYLGILRRIGIDPYTYDSIIEDGVQRANYITVDDHSLLTILKLHDDKYEKPVICHFIGITSDEYQKVLERGIKLGFFDSTGLVTRNGISHLKEIKRKVGYDKIRYRKKNMDEFRVKNITYLPKSFKGIT